MAFSSFSDVFILLTLEKCHLSMALFNHRITKESQGLRSNVVAETNNCFVFFEKNYEQSVNCERASDFTTILAVLSDCFTQARQIVFLIDRSNDMARAYYALKENSEKNLQICSNFL